MAADQNSISDNPRRIGIYAGVFNPVHSGHLAFALQAMERTGLDRIYFLPERQPRHKPGAEHFGHRVAMLKRAVQPHPQFGVLELPDINFSVQRTLPRLQKQFPGAQLVFLFGSDAVAALPRWPNAARLLECAELVVGVRAGEDARQLAQRIAAWPVPPRALTVFDSHAPDVSSGQVRAALRRRQPARGILRSVEHYSNRHWLYVSFNQIP